MSVELCNWIAGDFSAYINVSEIIGGTKITVIGESTGRESQLER